MLYSGGGFLCCSQKGWDFLRPRSIWIVFVILCSGASGILCPWTWFCVEWWSRWLPLLLLSCFIGWEFWVVAIPFRWVLGAVGPFIWQWWRGLPFQLRRKMTWRSWWFMWLWGLGRFGVGSGSLLRAWFRRLSSCILVIRWDRQCQRVLQVSCRWRGSWFHIWDGWQVNQGVGACLCLCGWWVRTVAGRSRWELLEVCCWRLGNNNGCLWRVVGCGVFQSCQEAGC